jgi:ABC-type antimicrobial peptide transport system permease subunit
MRLALGARRWDLIRLVLFEALRLAVAGAAVGLLAAAALARFLGALLYGVRGLDLPTFAAVAAVAIGVSAVASYVPARRATSADPMTAIRAE